MQHYERKERLSYKDSKDFLGSVFSFQLDSIIEQMKQQGSRTSNYVLHPVLQVMLFPGSLRSVTITRDGDVYQELLRNDRKNPRSILTKLMVSVVGQTITTSGEKGKLGREFRQHMMATFSHNESLRRIETMVNVINDHLNEWQALNGEGLLHQLDPATAAEQMIAEISAQSLLEVEGQLPDELVEHLVRITQDLFKLNVRLPKQLVMAGMYEKLPEIMSHLVEPDGFVVRYIKTKQEIMRIVLEAKEEFLRSETGTEAVEIDVEAGKKKIPDTFLRRAFRFQQEHPEMTDKKLVAEIMGWFGASFETVAHTLGWFLHELATHPDVMEKVRAEAAVVLPQIIDAIKNNPRDLERLLSVKTIPTTFAAMLEVLRLHSIVPTQFRQNYSTGELILLLPKEFHLDKEHWGEDADMFDESRFEGETFNDAKKKHHGWYEPFGDGATICAGLDLAQVELLIGVLMAVYTSPDEISQMFGGKFTTQIGPTKKPVRI
jgi:cytochrome P450